MHKIPIFEIARYVWCMILTLINANNFSTGIAVLGKHAVKAGQAVGPTLSHDVALASELSVAFEAREMEHVPGSALGLCTLVGKNDLERFRSGLGNWAINEKLVLLNIQIECDLSSII